MRETLRGVVRTEAGLPLPPRQQTAYTAIQVLRAEEIRLYVTPQLLHILQRPANISIASALLPDLHLLTAGRYLRRWARRLREEGVSHEDALIVSSPPLERGLGGFLRVDQQTETFGTDAVLTTDVALKVHYETNLDQLTARFQRMTSQLKAPYRNACLPTLLSPRNSLTCSLPDFS